MDTLLVLRAGQAQLPAILTAKQMGLRVVAIDRDPRSEGLKLADHGYVADIADVQGCFEIAEKHAIDGVVTIAAEYPVPTLAQICRRFALPGLTPEAATLATNKRRMRRALMEADVPCPVSIPVSTVKDAVRAARQIPGPAIFKPAISNGSRGITRLPAGAGESDLRGAFERAMSFTRGDAMLVEEFVDGPEFSIEGITWEGRTHVVTVTDKITSGSPYYVEIGHSQPSQVSPRQWELLAETTVRAVEALGIDWAASCTEIRLGRDGPCVMEVAARLGGGYLGSHLVPLSCGVDMVKATIEVALGRRPDVQPRHQKGAAIRFLTPNAGVVRRISGIAAAKQVPGLRLLEISVQPGDVVPPLLDGTCRVGHVICQADEVQTAIRRADEAKAHILVETEMAAVA